MKNSTPLCRASMISLCCLLVTGTLVLSPARSQAQTSPKLAPRSERVPPPTGDQLAKCFDFSAPVSLQCAPFQRRHPSKTEKPIWAYVYYSPEKTPVSFWVELYKAGTLFGKERKKLEQDLVKMQRDTKLRSNPRFSDSMGVKSLSNGRKIYYSMSALGPGGTMFLAFSTVGKYDLVVNQFWGNDDDSPESSRIKNPALPRRKLYEAFEQLEKLMPGLRSRN